MSRAGSPTSRGLTAGLGLIDSGASALALARSTSMALRAERAKTVFLSYAQEAKATCENVMALKQKFLKQGFNVIEHNGSAFLNCRLNDIDQTAHDDLDRCVVFVACVTREYHRNANCKSLCRIACSKIMRDKGKPFEVCYVMMQGDYTILSDEPYRIKGWLYYNMKDAITYMGWAPNQISASVDAIIGMQILLTKEMDIEQGENRSKMLEWKADIARKYPYMSLPKDTPPAPLNVAAIVSKSPNATLSPVRVRTAAVGKLSRSQSSAGAHASGSLVAAGSSCSSGGGGGGGGGGGTCTTSSQSRVFVTDNTEEEYAFEEEN